MKIELWTDFQCPFCFIGEKKLESVVGSVELTEPIVIDFKSYQLDPTAPLIPVESMTEHFMSGHDLTREEAEARMDKITGMAARVGLKLNLAGVKVCNTLDAHRLIKFASTRLSPDKLKRLNMSIFKANFEDNLLISDHIVLADIAFSLCLDRRETLEMLMTDAYKDEVRHDQEEIDSRKDFEFVPFMVANNDSVLQGVMSEGALRKWLTSAMAEEDFTPEETHEGCGPSGCRI